MPLAYRLPTIEPALVPVTTLTGMLCCSKTLITPMWAKPLEAPPPKAKPMVACGLGAGLGMEVCTGGVVVSQAAMPMTAARTRAARFK